MDLKVNHASDKNEYAENQFSFSETPAITLYLNEISKYPVLTAEEEQELAKKIANGDAQAKNYFTKCNLRLVVYVAKKYKISDDIDLLDLIQEGNIGLMHAVEKFDYTMGIKFSTYAVNWIRQTINNYIINCKDPIRIPCHIYESIMKYKSIQNDFMKNKGRLGSDIEVSTEMQISVSELQKIKSYIYTTSSLNIPISSDDDSELGDFIKDDSLTPEEQFIENSNKDILNKLVSHANLTKKEELIIRMRYFGSLTRIDSIAKELHRSKEAIRLTETRALKKLRLAARRLRIEL
jgi:RNA polymerase sigma factor (sigma-70 family)